MHPIEKQRVEQLIKEGYKVEIGEYISAAFNIFKSQWLLFSLYTLVAFLIFILSWITILGPFFVFFPLMLGFAVAADKLEENGQLQFSDFFGAFKNLGSFALIGALFMVCYLLIYSPIIFWIFYGTDGSFESHSLSPFGIIGFFGFIMFAIIVIFLIQIGLFFAPYLIHYGGYKAGDAISASFKLGFRNFWWLLVFVILSQIIAGVGQYLCGVGALASIPVAMLMNYVFVRKILIYKEITEIDEIGKTNPA